MSRAPAALAPAVALLAAIALSGCQSTQEKSAAIGRTAKRLTRETGLTIARSNAAVAVGRRTVIQDRNGAAAVVELRNGGSTA